MAAVTVAAVTEVTTAAAAAAATVTAAAVAVAAAAEVVTAVATETARTVAVARTKLWDFPEAPAYHHGGGGELFPSGGSTPTNDFPGCFQVTLRQYDVRSNICRILQQSA